MQEAETERILERALEGPIEPEEALALFRATENDNAAAEALFQTAVRVRERELGNRFFLTGGIAGVLQCRLKPLCSNCPYWRDVGKGPLELSEILEAVAYIRRQGIREFHLSGGTSLEEHGTDILQIVRGIREAGFNDMDIVVNCGATMSAPILDELRSLGVIEIGSVFEITNREVFRKVKPGDDLDRKMAFAKRILEAGIALETGIMAGLGPWETRYEDYVRSIFDIRALGKLRSVYVSKFMPASGIPMRDHPPCSAMEGARLIAIMRLVLRDTTITPAAGWKPQERLLPLRAGSGNSALGIHIKRKSSYWKTDSEKAAQAEGSIDIDNHIEELERTLTSLGLEICPRELPVA